MDQSAFEKNAIDRRKAQLNLFLQEFTYRPEYLKSIAKHVRNQIQLSYRDKVEELVEVPEFLGLDTHIKSLPSGNEIGVVYGVDIGGQYIRILRLTLRGRGICDADVKKYDMRDPSVGHPKGLLDKDCTATTFFRVISECLKDNVLRHEGYLKPIKVGFTFPFPVRMYGFHDAVVMALSKEFETGANTSDPLLGQNCIELLSTALKRQGLKAQIAGCVNDAASCLVTAAYKAKHHPHLPVARVGMIIGHGFNVCIMDDAASDYGYSGCVINLETAGLSCDDHLVDLLLDQLTANKGEHLGEKKISARYIPELIRLALLQVLESDAPEAMYNEWSLTVEQTGLIFARYRSSETEDIVSTVMQDAYHWTPPYPELCYIISEVIQAVWDRSAAIVAACMAGAADKTGKLRNSYGGVTVGVDGSLYFQNPVYQKRVRKYLRAVLGDRHRLLHVLISSNSAGKGAAMIAATFDDQE